MGNWPGMWHSTADAGAHKLLRTGRWVMSPSIYCHSICYHSTQSCPSRPNNITTVRPHRLDGHTPHYTSAPMFEPIDFDGRPGLE